MNDFAKIIAQDLGRRVRQSLINLNAIKEDATLYDHLGDIYAALNETEKARAAWEKSVSLDPKETVRKKLQPVGAK